MKRIISAALLSLFTCFASAAPCDSMVYKGVFPQTTENVTIICKKRYVIGYSTDRKAPLWVAEVISSKNVAHATSPRVNSFRPDPALPQKSQSSLSEFAGSGYDRGHMVPFENLADDPEAADESFVLTNMVAQAKSNNRGIWRALESRSRKLAVSKKKVFIITGTIFSSTPVVLSRGTNVPSHLWKVVISPSTKEVFAVIIPNSDGIDTTRLPEYNTTAMEIRKEAGVLIHGLDYTFSNGRME